MPAPTHVAFLRAVNLGGRRRVSSRELAEALEGIGLERIETFRASGNVIFAAQRAAEGELRQTIERAMGERFGFSVPVYLRTAAEVRELLAGEHFTATHALRVGRIQVAFLTSRPSPGLRERVLGYATSDDLLSFGKRELLWLGTSATQPSALNLPAVERLIGPWTMRTLHTVEELVARHFS
jgi:uncharacterized protein (DUF1697 family)